MNELPSPKTWYRSVFPFKASQQLPDQAITESRRGKWLSAFARILLAANLLLASAGWYISAMLVTARAQTRFDFETNDLQQAIRQRMTSYEQVLRGAVGLFHAAKRVDRQAFRTYFEALRVHESFPGIQGIAFRIRVLPTEKAALVKRMHSEGFTAFDILPAGERSEYHSIVYIEPFDWRNQRAIGFDMHTNPTRREAMDRARDSGSPAISGVVTLRQETDQNVQKGLVLYHPLYTNGTVSNTVAQRRFNLAGFVASPFRINDLMRGILGAASPDIGFAIFDGAERNEGALLYKSDATTSPGKPDSSQFTRTLNIQVSGRAWRIESYSRPGFIPLVESMQPLTVGIIGFVLSCLIYLFMESLGNRERRASALAQTMTLEVQERERRLRDIVNSAPTAFLRLPIDQLSGLSCDV